MQNTINTLENYLAGFLKITLNIYLPYDAAMPPYL